MLPPKLTLPADQQRLLALFARLSAPQREQLTAFAEFLAERGSSDDAAAAAAGEPHDQPPLDIPRPDSESVVAAIRRLSKTFHMLDKDPLLHETSALMTAHVMQGRSASDVIDELEIVFRRHYDRARSGSG
ncbi:MAG: Crp/Fnr family transcriptional regulator [Gammaproteobacteria bacterium]|nr:Crp/Fnr family transcriptional regulator [Gammaproteobacteria bacterium]